MSVPFGFSAGDLVAGVKLLKDVTDALGTSRKAQKEYEVLISIINSLNPLLAQAQALRLGQAEEEEIKSFREIATNIESFVANFIEYIAKFDGKLTAESRNWVARLGTACRKVEWTFLKPLVQDFISQLNTHVVILGATSSLIQLKLAGKPSNTREDSLSSQLFKHTHQQTCNTESTSSSLPIKLPCRDKLAPVMNDESTAGKGAKSSEICTIHVDSVSPIPVHGNHLAWPITKSEQVAFDYIPLNLHKIPRRRNRSLPIKNPADGSTKIFYKATGTVNQFLPDHELEPFFTIPGPSRKPIPIKNPLDGSIKPVEKDIKCPKNQEIDTGTRKAISQGFGRPTGREVVIKDPSDMRILNLSQITL